MRPETLISSYWLADDWLRAMPTQGWQRWRRIRQRAALRRRIEAWLDQQERNRALEQIAMRTGRRLAAEHIEWMHGPQGPYPELRQDGQ